MDIPDYKKIEYFKRISTAKSIILIRYGFFGLLLMHMKLALDQNGDIETVATDGESLIFNPSFLDRLSDDDLIFILLHEIMHIALRHTQRAGDRDRQIFDTACDIVVNSNILQSAGMDLSSITTSEYGVSIHKTPDGEEGYNYTAEEVYEMLQVQALNQAGIPGQNSSGSGSGSGNGSGDEEDDGNGSGDGDGSGDGNGSGDGDGSGDGNGSGDGDGSGDGSDSGNGIGSGGGFCDDHSRWGKSRDKAINALWDNRIRDAYEAAKGRGTVPAGVARAIKDILEPKVDWRTILNDFIQEEITDYSFMPPDRRFSDSPFFLPDFNDTETVVKDVLFMIDTSGSMSEEDLAQAYSEIKGAIDQFNGRLEGWLGFFDAAVVPPQPFADEEEFKVIQPAGGGGTDFKIIFDYVRNEMADREIASIIILTDGWAPVPEESAAMGIPVLWLINNEDEEVEPPWGRTVRF